jgi:hypothetical protein
MNIGNKGDAIPSSYRYATPLPVLRAAIDSTAASTEGPLRGISGVVVAASNERWLVVSINLLQRSVAVKLDRTSISSRAIYANPRRVGDSVQQTADLGPAQRT